MPDVSLVVIVIGEDRPGLVEAVSSAIAAQRANWVESRMARLAGKFAGILRVTVPQPQLDALRDALAGLEAEGLRVLVELADEESSQVAPRELVLELVGQDRAGIVRDVSHVLATHGVNVADLRTEITSAPMTAEPLFRARARVTAPAGVSLEALRAALESLADELMVDLSLIDDTP